MDKFRFLDTPIDGVKVIEPQVYQDARGYFSECYNEAHFRDAGIDFCCKQQNESASVRGVLRGLHFQVHFPQAKLVRALMGEVFDVAVDIRTGSATFGKWVGLVLSAENRKQLFIPKGFAHGYLVLSDTAEVAYKCDEFYHPEDEGGIRWDDPTVGVEWPATEKMINTRDAALLSLVPVL